MKGRKSKMTPLLMSIVSAWKAAPLPVLRVTPDSMVMFLLFTELFPVISRTPLFTVKDESLVRSLLPYVTPSSRIRVPSYKVVFPLTLKYLDSASRFCQSASVSPAAWVISLSASAPEKRMVPVNSGAVPL